MSQRMLKLFCSYCRLHWNYMEIVVVQLHIQNCRNALNSTSLVELDSLCMLFSSVSPDKTVSKIFEVFQTSETFSVRHYFCEKEKISWGWYNILNSHCIVIQYMKFSLYSTYNIYFTFVLSQWEPSVSFGIVLKHYSQRKHILLWNENV